MTITVAKEITGKDVLKLKMNPETNDAGAKTVKGYLKALLTTLIEEGEGFSGKRPFGNSSWEYELFEPLVKAGYVDGSIDEDGNIEYGVNETQAYTLIHLAISAL